MSVAKGAAAPFQLALPALGTDAKENSVSVMESMRDLVDQLNKTQRANASLGAPVGTLFAYAGASAPDGYLLCDGSAVSRTTYADLFTAIGTAFGTGDGSTTFNVPDLRGRAPIGAGTGSGLTARTLAATVGEENHTLTEAEMPSHTHDMSGFAIVGGVTNNLLFGAYNATPVTKATASAGSGDSHNTMQPSLVVNFIIKT